jgi:hypothetical protein
MADRGAILARSSESSFLGSINKSIIKRPIPFFSVRLMSAGFFVNDETGEQIFYGNTLTADQAEKINVIWGEGTDLNYTDLIVGYTYVWNLSTGNFVVTDTSANATTYTNIETIADLKISQDIFCSSQFSIIYKANADSNNFIIGTKNTDMRDAIHEEYKYSYVENYLNAAVTVGIYYAIYGKTNIAALTDVFDLGFIFSDKEKTIILSAMRKSLTASSEFVFNLTGSKTGTKEIFTRSIEREAFYRATGKMMMIAVFASIFNATYPALEPWMIFGVYGTYGKGDSGTFKWVSTDTAIEATARAFDLSPMWDSPR